MSQHHSRTHEIVETTLDLIESRGIGRLTTAALARRLGFTEAALYRYYPGKNAILAATLQRIADAIFLAMATDLAPATDGAPDAVARQLAVHVRRFTEHQGVLLDLLLAGTTSRGGEIQEAGSAFLEEYACRLAAYFDRMEELGLLRAEDRPQELAAMWMCQLIGGFVRSRLTMVRWEPDGHAGFRAFLHRLGQMAPARA
jgi:AcrR family transcriptional regulator